MLSNCVFRNPGTLVDSLYSPGLSCEKTAMPFPSDSRLVVCAVSTLVSTSSALGITAPVGSLTVTTTSPVTDCESAEFTQKNVMTPKRILHIRDEQVIAAVPL